MHKKMTEKTYFLRDAKDLDLQFYRSYDEAFLFRKAETLMRLVDDVEKYKTAVLEEDGENFDQKKFVETLNAEIHFTEFHQFEAFFAVLIAVFQNLPHWLYLTTYTTREIKQKVEAFLEKDIKKASNGFLDNSNEFINTAVYAGFKSDDDTIAKNWQQNLDNINWFITRIARKYLEGTEYNAYKHGLRVITGHTFIKFSPTGQPDKGFQYSSDNSIRFLELDEVEKNKFQVKETFKHFNPVESINHLYFMYGILETIKSVRMARINGETKANLNSFSSLDKDNLNKMRVATKWSMSL